MEAENTGDLELVEEIPLSGHIGKVWCLSWSPHPCDGADHMLASGGEDGTILWSSNNSMWSLLQRLDNKGSLSVNSCAWHPTGKILATGGCSSRVVLWEYKEELFMSINAINSPYDQIIKSLSWDEQGTFLLCCADDGAVTIIGNLNGSYQSKHVLPLLDNVPLSSSLWHPNQGWFVVGGFRNLTVHLARQSHLDKDKVIVNKICTVDKTCLNYHSSSVSAISCSQTGKIVSAGVDGTLRFWNFDVEQSKCLLDPVRFVPAEVIPRFQGSVDHKVPIMSIDCSRCVDGFENLIATGCLHQSISLYGDMHQASDLQQTRRVLLLKKASAHSGAINDLKWHPKDWRLLASASSDSTIKIWRVRGNLSYPGTKRREYTEPPIESKFLRMTTV